MDKTLQNCKRGSFGEPIAQHHADNEVKLADLIRLKVVSVVSQNSDAIANLSKDIPFLLDREARSVYASVKHRCIATSTPNEYAGFLEIVAASYVLGVQICLYTKTTNQSSGLLEIAKFPAATTEMNNGHVSIVHRLDTTTTAGHFDLLLPLGGPRDDITGTFLYDIMDYSGFTEYLLTAVGDKNSLTWAPNYSSSGEGKAVHVVYRVRFMPWQKAFFGIVEIPVKQSKNHGKNVRFTVVFR